MASCSLAKFFQCGFYAYQPLRNHYSPMIFSLDFNCHFEYNPCPPSIPLWTLVTLVPLMQQVRFSILFGGKVQQQLKALKIFWKVINWCTSCTIFICVLTSKHTCVISYTYVHLLASCNGFKPFITKLLMCDLGWFLKSSPNWQKGEEKKETEPDFEVNNQLWAISTRFSHVLH